MNRYMLEFNKTLSSSDHWDANRFHTFFRYYAIIFDQLTHDNILATNEDYMFLKKIGRTRSDITVQIYQISFY